MAVGSRIREFDLSENSSWVEVQAGNCELFNESLEFLGHRIDAKGIYPSKAKVEAIHQAPALKTKKELKPFWESSWVGTSGPPYVSPEVQAMKQPPSFALPATPSPTLGPDEPEAPPPLRVPPANAGQCDITESTAEGGRNVIYCEIAQSDVSGQRESRRQFSALFCVIKQVC
ncbi:hypothetical protein MRX96_028453 [Rhipicephalus microplus]